MLGHARIAAVFAGMLALGGGAVEAQSFNLSADQKTELRAEQRAVFEQMFQAPDDLDLMFRYALISIQLEDLEAAITTLERMLIYNKDLPRVHMELGAAYYRLGSYETAKYYFTNTLAFDNVPGQVRGKAEEFLAAIDRRTQKSVLVGSAGAGLVYASNANLGPDDSDVLLFGAPATLNNQFLEDDDFAARATLNLTHYYDLDRPNSDRWRTDFSAFSLHYFDETNNDIDAFLLRTGPQLSLDDQEFGPKIRPIVELDYVRAGNDDLYGTAGVGAEYQDTISDTMSLFGSLRVGYRDYFNGQDDFDSLLVRGSVGAAFIPDQNTVVRAMLFAERRDADDDINSTIEVSARLSGTMTYESGFDFAERLWALSGFVQGSYRIHDDPDPVLVGAASGRERRDVDFRAGVSNTFYLMDGFWISAEVNGLLRDSNIRNFDIDNFGGGITAGIDF